MEDVPDVNPLVPPSYPHMVEVLPSYLWPNDHQILQELLQCSMVGHNASEAPFMLENVSDLLIGALQAR